jgi:hypothetical protein
MQPDSQPIGCLAFSFDFEHKFTGLYFGTALDPFNESIDRILGLFL